MISSRSQDINLRYLDLDINVSSHDINDIIWLKEFLFPQFEMVTTATSDCAIRLVMDDAYFDKLKGRVPSKEEKIVGFVLDKRVAELSFWQTVNDGKIYHDEEFDIFYGISHDRRSVSVLAHSKKSVGYRTALMRVIREYAINHARSKDIIFVHAGAFSFEGRGIGIAGKKNSGKTSTLTYFLKNMPVKYISNDRVLVSFENDVPVVFGMPTIVTVSDNGLSLFEKLRGDFRRYNYHHRYTIDEIKEAGHVPYRLEKGDFTLSPGQYVRLMNVGYSQNAPLKAIIFPKISKEEKSMSVRLLERREAFENLTEAELSKDIHETQSVFNLGENIHSANRKNMYKNYVDRITSQIPCFECSLGRYAYHSAHAVKILETLLAAELDNVL